MFAKTLIVSLLALLCLQVAFADRLNTRIAGNFQSSAGQFPYIVFITYNYADPAGSGAFFSQQSTGILYSPTGIITTAKTFDFFAANSNLTVQAGSFDVNQPIAFYTFPATVGSYALPAGNATGPAPSADLVQIPSTYAKGATENDIAIIRLPAGAQFNTSHPEIKTANFPTSSPVPSDPLFAVAYGNQSPGSATFPTLKYAQMYLKRATLCQRALTNASVAATYNRAQHFCLQSQDLSKTNNTFEGVCRLDVSGAVMRTFDITQPNVYQEVVGLVTYAADATTCDNNVRVPAVIIYLSYFQNNFITPILGSLAATNNGQDPTKNPNSKFGNFICGNGIVEAPFETCDLGTNAPSTSPCCSPNACSWRQPGQLCGVRTPNATVNRCLTRPRCDKVGKCGPFFRNQGKQCFKGKPGRRTKCVKGVCNRCNSNGCTPL